jgi:mRNA degradation ribonuclease J1/J2
MISFPDSLIAITFEKKVEARGCSDKLWRQCVDHKAIRNNPDNYILCFSFFDMKHLLDIKPNGGTYIYSACEAFNEEMEIDFKRLWHWLKRFNIYSCGFSLDENGVPSFGKRYHASGHASGEDITGLSTRSIQTTLCLFTPSPGTGLPRALRTLSW